MCVNVKMNEIGVFQQGPLLSEKIRVLPITGDSTKNLLDRHILALQGIRNSRMSDASGIGVESV